MASHFSSRNIFSSTTSKTTEQKRHRLRRVILETLERRELLAYDLASGIYAPGTPSDYIDGIESRFVRGSGHSNAFFDLNSRWTNPTGGASPNQGDPATVTWSIVPDGTQAPNLNSALGDSNLVQFMDAIYGAGGGGAIQDRPWFNIFERAYDSWSELTGLNFVYEAMDDGAAYSNTSRGVTGVRGDIRLGGRAMDGNGGVLAFNYTPAGGGDVGWDGDMVIDTSGNDILNAADGPNGENRYFFNILMHEIGHGIGLGHVRPVNQSKLMEPFASSAFLGAQHDDILGGHELYGDDLENNDTQGTATDLGDLLNGRMTIDGLSANRATDDDWYEFAVSSRGQFAVTVTPTGEQYRVGNTTDGSDGTDRDTDSLRYLDLSFELYDAFGAQLAAVNATGLGESETLTLDLPEGGTYFLKVVGSGAAHQGPQMYDLEFLLSGFTTGFATGQPRLLSIAPNSGEIFSFNSTNSLDVAPTELVFRFDGAESIDPATLENGLRVTRAGGDGTFGDGNEEIVVPGFVGLGENDRIAIMRFATTLKDDLYRVEVFGEDGAEPGAVAVKNPAGVPILTRAIDSTRDDLTRDSIDFNLELGALVQAVVPQPVDRGPDGSLVPQRDKIRVYFNDDDLHGSPVATGDPGAPSVVDPSFYQLILTNDSVQPGDDEVFMPTSISYDPATDIAELTFSAPIDQLAGAGTYRLRVGGNDAVVSAANPGNVQSITPAADPSGFASGAQDLGPINSAFSAVISESIETTDGDLLPLDYPGSPLDPGQRDIQDEAHVVSTASDSNPGISTFEFNFALDRPYGVDAQGRPISTSITPDQIARVREGLEFYSRSLGVDFVETEDSGVTIVVGDTFPFGVSGQGDNGFFSSPANLIVMDAGRDWDNSFAQRVDSDDTTEYFLPSVMREIGRFLGFGYTFDLPEGTFLGSEDELDNSNKGLSYGQEWNFPGDADIVHGRFLHRPDNRDVDTYRFEIASGQTARVVAETIAERLADSSNLDTHLTLFRRTSEGFEVVAQNDDNVSSDSLIDIELGAGEYFLSVTGSGNEDFNIAVDNTGSGATSQGDYQLRLDITPVASSIVDTAGTPIDGDGDGKAGGNFNFWFRTAAPIDEAAVGEAKTVYVDKDNTGAQDGSAAAPFRTLPAAIAAVSAGDIIRVAGTQGLDGDIATPSDNPAYEIGRGGVGNGVLEDGLVLSVPQGVTLMVDAGAIFKLGSSRISTGSLNASTNNSFSALQVLGVPGGDVLFTSYNDESLGVDTNPLGTTPRSGDWGGIDFHGDVDRAEGRGDHELNGVFLNYVSHADIRYGGGQVTVTIPNRVVSPITMSESRPTLLNNKISLGSDAALSADPNSFEETRFTHPRYQLAESFKPDYARTGPDIRGNILTENSTNGLFVRTTTAPGQPLTTLNVAGRFDDTDIVHVLGENLIVRGTPGGAVREETAPDVSLTQRASVANGDLAVGAVVEYKVTFVDRFGGVSIPSESTPALTLTDTAVELQQLPRATGDFVGRRLWRSTDGGAYKLVAELDGDTTAFTDVGQDLQAELADPDATDLQRARLDGRLQIDPGIIVKSSGARIEAGIGAQIIAEGTSSNPVVFTSRFDDTYGASGTFDTNNDSVGTNPSAGDWAGIVARHLSSLSLDNVLVTYAGGPSSISGSTAAFNAVEVHQADARISNSVFRMNQSGIITDATRDGRGPNEASVIFVSGSQPVIINNTFRDNSISGTAAISINANALDSVSRVDFGRQTGLADRLPTGVGNKGPLVNGNLLSGNSINGMRVRGQTLTTESIWDDTDIVHVLQSEVIVPDVHTYGGLRLQSRSDESLVVKLDGDEAGFTAMGRPLDIEDRIGGTLQIVGQPGFPVYLTSLSDDSVGAGFDPTGRALVDTNNDGPSTGSAGDWRSIRLEPYANDRNVNILVENETDQIQESGTNDTTIFAEDIGALASTLAGGDENLRLGVSIDGTIAAPQDLDVYTFLGTGGTEVWVDVDRTSGGLDVVVELLDPNGNILAQSNNSLRETAGTEDRFVSGNTAQILPGQVLPLTEQNQFYPDANGNGIVDDEVHSNDDLYSTNPHDAGMRLQLPGAIGETNQYFIRVRSSNVGPGQDSSRLQDSALEREGLSTGAYRLQVRMQDADEFAGSVVRYADIRYATNGIEANGMPTSSQLLGTLSTASGTTIDLGNITNADRGSVTVAGSIDSPSATNVFDFQIRRDSVKNDANHVAVTFDIDYADGFGRPNTRMWVFNLDTNALVLVGTDSNIADDQAAPLNGVDTDDLSRGSAGSRDAYIGTVELPVPSGSAPARYRLIVTNESQIAAEFDQYQTAAATNPNFRLEPINSIARIAVDRFENWQPETGQVQPIQTLFPNGGVQTQNAVPWTLADVSTYVVSSSSLVQLANPLTGARDAFLSLAGRTLTDAALRPDGALIGYALATGAVTDANSGEFLDLDNEGLADDANVPTVTNSIGSHGIQTFTTQQTGFGANPTFAVQQRNQAGDGIIFNGLTYFHQSNGGLRMFGVGSRGNGAAGFNQPILDANNGVIGISNTAVLNGRNVVYRLDPNSGQAINRDGQQNRTAPNVALGNHAGTQIVEYGRFLSGDAADSFTLGTVTGLAQIGSRLFAVSNLGEFFVTSIGGDGTNSMSGQTTQVIGNTIQRGVDELTTIVDPETNQAVSFTGLTEGPRNLEGGRYSNILFGTTQNGTIYAFDTAGNLQPVFPGYSYKTVTTSLADSLGNGIVGIDFSTLDVNLWHQTNRRGSDDGHGRTAAFDNSQTFNRPGGNSLYFGFDPQRNAGNWSGAYNVAAFNNTVNLPGGAHGAIVSQTLDLTGYSPDDRPMLYFNYFLQTTDSNADTSSTQRMEDAVRVYAAGEDGSWKLLATNNTASDGGGNRLNGNDEYDRFRNGGNADAFGNEQRTQELFDAADWRQARTSLAALAGQDNVRIRFEFSTGATFDTGDPLRGGVEITAVDASRTSDGDYFKMVPDNDVSQVDARAMELDHGLVLNVPSAASIVTDASTISIAGTDVVFSETSDAGNNVQYAVGDSAAEIAEKLRVRLPEIIPGISVSVNPVRPNVVGVLGLPAMDFVTPNYTVTELGDGVIAAFPGAASHVIEPMDGPTLAFFESLGANATLTINGREYTFTANPTGPDSIPFTAQDSSFDVAASIVAALQNDVANNQLDPLEIQLVDGVDAVKLFNAPVGDYSAAPPSMLFAVDSAAVAQDLTYAGLRDVVRQRMADTYTNPFGAALGGDPRDAWPVIGPHDPDNGIEGRDIRVHKFSISDSTFAGVDTSGLGVNDGRDGDDFGVGKGGVFSHRDEKTQSNNIEGVYIDDIIVGLAERGEMAFGSTGTQNIVANQQYDDYPLRVTEIEEGPYQLTIRTSAEYGIGGGNAFSVNPNAGARVYSSNDRLSKELGIQVQRDAAGNIVDGATFTLSDGGVPVTFEFDVTSGPGDLAEGVASGNIPVTIDASANVTEIAEAIRDAINSPTARLVLDLTASTGVRDVPSTRFPPSDRLPVVLLHGDAGTDQTGDFTFDAATFLEPVIWGRETGFGQDTGDSERERQQGQLLLIGNTITDSSEWGIRVTTGTRSQGFGDVGNRPYPGAPINLPTLNTEKLAPGVVVMNNIIATNGSGGLDIAGDPGADAPVQIARVLNNTIYGDDSGTGVRISGAASPTIMNNIFASNSVGIAGPGNSTAIVIANAFHENGTNSGVPLGSFNQFLGASEPLFVDPSNRRFYLAAGSPAIDSSLEALQERPALAQVRNSIGLPVSPMLAPDLDVTGQRRVDDPTANSPAGLGGNVFKDRGAVDRSDFIGLEAVILQPQDNDSLEVDVDRTTTYIQLQEGTLEFFSILLLDRNGTGPDPSTVISRAVTLTENGRLLRAGTDYIFGYNANSRTIQLTPVAGIWRSDSVYEITLANDDSFTLDVSNGGLSQDGETFSVTHGSSTTVFELDSDGNVDAGSVAVPFSVDSSEYEIALQLMNAINTSGTSLRAYLQGDGAVSLSGASAVAATGATITSRAVGGISDLAGNPLFANRVNSLTQFTIVMPNVQLDYGDASFDADGRTYPTVATDATGKRTLDPTRNALLPIDVPLIALGAFADGDMDGQPSIDAQGDDSAATGLTTTIAGATISNSGAILLDAAASPVDGETFTITDPQLRTATFEFDDNGSISLGNLQVAVPIGATAAQAAEAVRDAVNDAVLSGSVGGLIAFANGSQVSLGGTSDHAITVGASLTRLGTGTFDLTIPASVSDGDTITINDGRGRVAIFEIDDNPSGGPASVASGNLPITVDLASAAAEDIATATVEAINAAVSARRLVIAPAIADGPTIRVSGDDEDGVSFGGLFNANLEPAPVTVTSTAAGVLDVWFDWNADGDFSDAGERVVSNMPVQAGENIILVSTPATAQIGATFSRFRISTSGNLPLGGLAIGGEVEDHLVEIVAGEPPVAVDDNYSVDEDEVLTVAAPGILANDTDADSPALTVLDQDPLTPEIDPFRAPQHGTVVLNADGSFTYTPDHDYFGEDTFVYYAADERLQSSLPATVTITVNPINDSPTAKDDEITILEDEVILRSGDEFTANDFKGIEGNPSQFNELGQDLEVVGVSILHPDVGVYGGSVSVIDNQITYVPPAHYNNNIDGPALIKVTIRDSGVAGADAMPLESTSTLTINLTAVNDAPEFAMPATTSVIEDAGPVVVDNFLTDLRPGPTIATDESDGPAVVFEDQQVAYTVTALDETLFATLPAIAGSTDANPGRLTYELAPNVSSADPFPEILVTVTAVDTGLNGGPNNDVNTSETRTFTIIPTPVNDAPEFEIQERVASLEDQGVVTITDFMTGIRPGPASAIDEAGQMLSVVIDADPTAFTAAGYPTIDLETGDLVYQTAPHVNQFTGQNFVVEVTVIDDGGTALGGVDRTSKSFTIDVTELNDAPEYDMPSVTSAFQEDPTADPDAPTVVPNFASNIMPGPSAATDEGPAREDQQVSFLVRPIDAATEALFDPNWLPTIDASGTLTYRLNPDVNEMTPFPTILVEVIASDTGLNDDPSAGDPRNINTADTRTFTILPDPINDAPEFTIPATLDAREDQGATTAVDFVTEARPGPVSALDELASQTLTITVEALDPSAFTATGQPAIVLDQATGLGTLTFELAPDVNSLTGHDLGVRVTLQDDGGTANAGDVDTTIKTFTLIVDDVNDAPSFDIDAPEVTVDEDQEDVVMASPTVIPGFASNIVAGPDTALDETTIAATKQVLTFETLSVSDPSLFAVEPMITPDGDLVFTTADNQNGTAVVVVRLMDNGDDASTGEGDVNISTESTFTITLRAINDAPEFTIPATANSIEDQGLVTIPNFATDMRPGPVSATDEAGQQFTVTVTATDPSAFAVLPTIGADGTLAFETAKDINSNTGKSLEVTVFLTDDGTDSPLPHRNVSEVKTFTITTTPVNDEPLFTLTQSTVTVIEDVEEFEGTLNTVVPGFATNIAPGPATATDETGQTVNFEVISVTAPELFDEAPAIDADTGDLSFKTAQHKNGKSVVVVRLVDDGPNSPAPNDNLSRLHTFTISITPINDEPEFSLPNQVIVDEDAGLVSRGQFATNVRRGPVGADDENSQLIQFDVIAMDPSSFTVQPSIGVDGTLTFQTAEHVNSLNADLRVVAVLRDNGAAAPIPNDNMSPEQTFTIQVNAVNDAPTADAFQVASTEDTSLTILSADVLVGDVAGPTPDELNQSLRITQVARTSQNGGSVVPVFGNPADPTEITSINYLPPANLAGTDFILYVVTDDGSPQRSGTGTITISIEGVNDAPQFSRGADQAAPEDAGLVTIDNWASNILAGPPSAADELAEQTVTFRVIAVDSSLFAVQPAISSDGTLTFTPAKDANGSTAVVVWAEDDGASTFPNVNVSAAQTFTIRINPVNDEPVFTAGGNITVDEDSPTYTDTWATNIAAAAGLLDDPQTAGDEANQGLDFNVVADRPELFSVQPTISSTGVLTFTPQADAFGQAVITATLVDRGPANAGDDNTSDTATFTVTINPTNDRPVAVADSFNTTEDSSLNVLATGLLRNDTDVDLPLDSLSVVAGDVVTDAGVTVTLNADGSFTYDATSQEDFQQLQAGQSVFDRFTYTIQDTAGSVSLPGTVTIRVDGIDDAPVANDDTFSIGVGNGRDLPILANDTDVDSTIDPQTIDITANPAFGSVEVNGLGIVRYTPDAGFRGADTFRYTVRDSSGNISNEAIVTVNVNSAPVAADDSAITVKNEAIEIDILGNDRDIDGTIDPTTVRIERDAVNGVVEVLQDGSVRFTPNTNVSGEATFSYSVRDNVGTPSNVATVTVQILNSKWQNPSGFLDVNADGTVSPIDALILINYINSGAETDLRLTDIEPAPYLDPNGDEIVTPSDVLMVINFLNANSAGGEGEASTDYAMMVTPEQVIATVGPQIVKEIEAELEALRMSVLAEGEADELASQAAVDFRDLDDDEAVMDALTCSHDEEAKSEFDSAIDDLFSDDLFNGYGPQRPR